MKPILAFLLLCTVAHAAHAADNPRRMKLWDIVPISGSSMDPNIKAGQLVMVVPPTTIEELNLGDPINYWREDLQTNVTHRVIKKGKALFGPAYVICKGDNNRGPDNMRVTQKMLNGYADVITAAK